MDFDEYMQEQFGKTQNEDLSLETGLLRKDAERIKQKKGGKFLGMKLLEKLLKEFNHPALQLLPYKKLTPKKDTVRLSIRNNHSDHLILRSNASFEYGSPPGILESLHFVPNDKRKIDITKLLQSFQSATRHLDAEQSFHLLVQPQLFPRASGIVYTSFDTNEEDPVIIEASLGSCISATLGLPNIIHYRITKDTTETYRNFNGERPITIFTGQDCFIDSWEADICRREMDAYRNAATKIEMKRTEKMAQLWQQSTFSLPSEKHSPLKQEELQTLYEFGKFAESKLKKPLKLEFSIDEQGKIYLLQLDPAILEVSNQELNLDDSDDSILLTTPFINMPVKADGLEVQVEVLTSAFGYTIPESDFAYIPMTLPMNLNIAQAIRNYPQLKAIVAGSGSRMNHCYSEVRTFVPYLGVPGLFEKVKDKFNELPWGHNKELRMDIRSDGRMGQIKIYK